MLQRRSIRWYLFALVLGVALPLMSVLLAEWHDNAQRDELRAADASLQLARIAAEETSRFVADTRTLLVTLGLVTLAVAPLSAKSKVSPVPVTTIGR